MCKIYPKLFQRDKHQFLHIRADRMVLLHHRLGYIRNIRSGHLFVICSSRTHIYLMSSLEIDAEWGGVKMADK